MGAALGSVAGAVGGIFGSQKNAGVNVGNTLYSSDPNFNQNLQNTFSNAVNNTSGYNDPSKMTGLATQQVQSNPMLSQAFGSGGLMDQTGDQITQLQNQGFNLTPQDQTAYGQAAGQIAQQFGQNNQGLAQSLSNRGLSNSGAAGAGFTNSYGNQNEQLAQLQTQIAQNRYNMTQNQLNSARSFYGQLQGQAGNALNSQVSNNLAGQNQQLNQANMAQNYLQAQQGQATSAAEVERNTQTPTMLSNAFNGAMGGMTAGSNFMNTQSNTSLNNSMANRMNLMSSPLPSSNSVGSSLFSAAGMV